MSNEQSPTKESLSPGVGPGPNSRALAERLRKVETSNVTWLSKDFPVFWEKGHGVFVEDVDGRSYLDMTAAFGVTALGHAPRESSDALRKQSERLVHGMGDVHPPAIKVEFLERLAAIAPVEEPRITLGTGGSMATEIALKSTYLATGRPGVLAFEGGYHGLTLGSLSVVGHEKFLTPFSGIANSGLPRIPFPESHEGTTSEPGCEEVLEQTESMFKKYVDTVGGVIVEPIQGRGGIRIPPKGFLTGLRKLCSDRGVLLICDEILTGFHRTGPMFASEAEGIRPDLILLGKALAGGMPIGACVGTKTVMDSFGASTGEAIHTETFLGHPATMATALATLDAFERAPMQDIVETSGQKLASILRQTLGRHPDFFGEPVGRGLMWGVGCFNNGEPSPELTGRMVRASLGAGLIILGGGVHGHVLQFTPALTITDDEIAEMAARLDKAVKLVLKSF